MKALVKSFAIFSVLLSSVALAHEAIEIKSSTPSKNAMLMEAPMELSVSFTKGVRLIKVGLKMLVMLAVTQFYALQLACIHFQDYGL